MSRKQDDLQVVPPVPEDECAPLLADENGQAHDHGTIEEQDAANGADIGGDSLLVKEPSTSELVIVMGCIWVGTFLAALDSTIIATLTTPISNSFNSFTLVSWLASGYLIANAALQPLSGKLTDIFGRRSGLVFSNIFFGAGNLICGLAQSESTIIIGRVVAGIGGGGLTAISTFIGSDLVPLRRRGVWQGFGNICYGLGMGVGGVFGGWINDVWGWRKAFLIQVPLVVVSCVLVIFTVKVPVKETKKSKILRVDFLGAFTLTAALVLLLLGLNYGGNIVPWTHPLVLTTVPLSFVFLLAFIFVEDRIASEPIIPVRLLLERTVWSACLTNWFQTMAAYSMLYYAPIYFQIRGSSAAHAGARIVPQAVGTALGSLGAGMLMRATGRYYLLNIGIEIITILAYALIAGTFNLNTPLVPPLVYFFLAGLGYGAMLTLTLLALIAAVDHKHQATITSASYAFRSTGSTIGITICSTVFQNVLKNNLWERFGDRKGAAEIIGRLRNSIGEIQHLPSGWKDSVLDTYMQTLRMVWFTILGMSIAGAVVSLLLKEYTLHKNLQRK